MTTEEASKAAGHAYACFKHTCRWKKGNGTLGSEGEGERIDGMRSLLERGLH